MKKILMAPVLLACACAAAALYGAVHNQISYTVAPSYFHAFKFDQFRLAPELWTRAGASLVGVLASWWMGLVLGLPVYVAACFVRGEGAFVRKFLQAIAIVICVTLLVGLGALAWAYVSIGPETLPWWMDGRDLSDPVGFARAGHMHNFSYLGGLIGAVAGLAFVIRAAFVSREVGPVEDS